MHIILIHWFIDFVLCSLINTHQWEWFSTCRYVSAFLVGVHPAPRRAPTHLVLLFEFLRVSSESRLISNLSVQHRHGLQRRRIAARLANISTPIAPQCSSTTCPHHHSKSAVAQRTLTNDKCSCDGKSSADIFRLTSIPELNTFRNAKIFQRRDVKRDESNEKINREVTILDALSAPLPIASIEHHVTCEGDRPKCLDFSNGGRFD